MPAVLRVLLPALLAAAVLFSGCLTALPSAQGGKPAPALVEPAVTEAYPFHLPGELIEAYGLDRLTFRFTITKSGALEKPTLADLTSAQPLDPALRAEIERIGAAALSTWRFSPGTRQGRPTPFSATLSFPASLPEDFILSCAPPQN